MGEPVLNRKDAAQRIDHPSILLLLQPCTPTTETLAASYAMPTVEDVLDNAQGALESLRFSQNLSAVGDLMTIIHKHQNGV